MKARILILSVLSSLMSALLSAQPAIPQLQAPVPDSFGYTSSPDTTGIGLPVGSVPGTFAVSPLGAATYSMPIECPPGVNGLQPQIGIAYNSQAGNGVVGYGFSITGLSCITRGPRTVYHDGSANGIHFDVTDEYYCDGKRLLLQSGTPGTAWAFYTLEGLPLDTLIYRVDNGHCWFSMRSHDGMYYEFGHTQDGTLSTLIDEQTVPLSWYVTRIEDPSGNYMLFSYVNDANYIYPHTITYSHHLWQPSQTLSTISFFYESRQDIINSYTKGMSINMRKRLKSIETGTASDLYRRYTFDYTQDEDNGFSLLSSVGLHDGNGVSLPSTTFEWQEFSSCSRTSTAVSYTPIQSRPGLAIGKPVFFSGDFNCDGISDIVQYANVETDAPSDNRHTYSFVSLSKKTSTGERYYELPFICKTSPSSNVIEKKLFTRNLGPMLLDFDGDGLSEYVVPRWTCNNTSHPYSSNMMLEFFRGWDLWNASYTEPNTCFATRSFSAQQVCPDEALHLCADFNNDGRTDILFIERAAYSNSSYGCHLFSYNDNRYAVAEDFHLQLPNAPKHVFCSDFDHDGLTDILVFHETGYRIFYNQGGNGNSCFSSLHCDTYTSVPAAKYMYGGDFNGDSELDILYHDGEQNTDKTWYIAFNYGHGNYVPATGISLAGLEGSVYSEENDDFQCIVSDFNADGKSDVFLNRGHYIDEDHYVGSYAFWLYSTGNSLICFKSASVGHEKNGYSGNFFAGNFTGSGHVEIANYGYDCFSPPAGSTDSLRIYTAENEDFSNGKLTGISQGNIGNLHIEYDNLTNNCSGINSIAGQNYPLVQAIIPLSVVRSTQSSNGVASPMETYYTFGPLVIGINGKGFIGYKNTEESCCQTGVSRHVYTHYYDESLLLPTSITEVFSYPSGSDSRDISLEYERTGRSGNNYYAVVENTEDNSEYQGRKTIIREYDNGVLSSECETADSLTRQILYRQIKTVRYKRVPTEIVKTDYHKDASSSFTDTTLITYDAFARPTRVVHHAGTAAAYSTLNTYDDWGNLTATVDSGHPTIRISHVTEYDATHRFPAATYIQTNNGTIAGRKQYTYDTWGNMLTETDLTNTAQPLTTTHAYDGWGNRLSTTAPTGHRTQYDRGRTADGYFTLRRGISQPWVKTTYDSTGRELSTETRGAGGIVVKTTNSYDTRGRLHTKTEQQGERTLTTSYTYDARDRITQVSDDTGTTSTFSYGLRSSTETIGGRTYTKTYDAWGNVKTSSDPVATVSYLYNSQGLPRSVTTAGSTVTMTYDQAGRRLTLTDPDAGTMTTAYDVLGNITRQTDARGKTVTYTYDKFGREQRKIYDGNSIARTYGTSGNSAMRLTSEYNTGMSVSYAYDGYGRIVSETRTADNSPRLFTYSYNPDGSLATVTYPDTVTVAYTYDCYGYRKGMTVDGQQAWTLGGKNGADIYWHLNGGCSLSHSYDKKGRLVSRTNYTPITISPVDGGLLSGDGLNGIGDHGSLPVDTMITDPGTPGVLLGTSVHEMAFTYDHQTGNLTSRTIGGITESFTYDSLDRLTTVTQGSSTPLSVSYADGGNILSKTGLGSYSYDSGKPHAVTGVENTAGLVSDIPQTITYNGIGQATRIHQQAREAVISYGPDETRWKTAFTDTGLTRRLIRYYGDYEEVDSFGPHPGIPAVATKKYHWLPGDVLYVRQGDVGRLYYLATDHLGSIREVMKADGDLTSVFHADYDAWGRQTVSRDSIGIYRGYTGHEMLPEFGLINMNGRMYDPLLGRFLSPDNYVQLPDLSQSFNRYSYCLNNPLKYTDPSGEYAVIDDILAALIGGTLNLGGNLLSGEVHSFWHGLSLFGVGALAGWAAEYNPYASAIIIGGGNSFVNQGFTNGFGSIDYEQIFGSTMMSLMTAGFGQMLSSYTSPLIDRFLPEIQSPILDNVLRNGLDNSISGFALGTLFSFNEEGQTLGGALQEGLVEGGKGLVLGAISGIGTGIKEARKEFLNPWTGEIKGFSSFSKLKEYYGPAGDGYDWHHIVEQRTSNIEAFGLKKIHNIDNLQKLPHDLHLKVSGYYSSKQPFTNGLTVREWLNGQSYNKQYKFGKNVLKKYGRR